MADLKTNYRDDVLNTEVNERRKYQMIQNDDGTVSFVDVTDYSQVGDSFGAVDINATNEKCNELNNSLVGIKKTLLYKSSEIVPIGANTEITLNDNINNYSFYEIIFAPEYTNILRSSSGIIQTSSPVQTISATPTNDQTTNTLLYLRNFIPNNNKMIAGGGYYYTGLNQGGAAYTGCNIPTRIYGYK